MEMKIQRLRTCSAWHGISNQRYIFIYYFVKIIIIIPLQKIQLSSSANYINRQSFRVFLLCVLFYWHQSLIYKLILLSR